MSEILVIGATGKTGRRLAGQLARHGATVRPASRQAGTWRFDWDDPATWGPALDGVDGVYFLPPAARLDFVPLMTAFIGRLAPAGVSRAVFLSFRGADAGNDNPFRQTELALLASGTGATVIRPSLFSQNFTEGFLAPPIRDQAVIAAPAGTGRVPFIDAGDIAAVAAAALLNDGHAGRAYDLSGPRVLSFADAAATLSAATGRTIGYLDVPATDWEAGTIAAGVPADYARFLSVLFETLRAGQHDYLTDGVQQVLGRQPRAFGDWAHAEAAQIPAR